MFEIPITSIYVLSRLEILSKAPITSGAISVLTLCHVPIPYLQYYDLGGIAISISCHFLSPVINYVWSVMAYFCSGLNLFIPKYFNPCLNQYVWQWNMFITVSFCHLYLILSTQLPVYTGWQSGCV